MPKYTTLFLLTVMTLAGCKKPPEYPNEPDITFNSISYKNSGGIFDSITIAVDFKDGDGDLGLLADETDYPYNPYFFLLDSNKDTIRLGNPQAPPFNFYDYEIIENDTFYIERNPTFFNFLVEVYIEDANGDFYHQEYRDWCISSNICIPFHGRFPPLSDRTKPEPLEGTIRYTIASSQFPKARIKFKVSIYDRDLNKSNEVETDVLDLR